MRRVLAVMAMVSLLIAGLLTQGQIGICQGILPRLQPRGLETLAMSQNSAVRFDAAHVSTDVLYTVMHVGPNPIRYRVDATAPTQTVGHFAAAHVLLEFCGNTTINNFRALAIGALGAEAHVNATHFIPE